ncbi:MAG: hypothetical protein ABRQ30_03785 [Smithellaceae bacterium]|jgi:hypothetical protein
MNIDLHIEELILFGFAPGDRQRIAEAVQEELARLLRENKLSAVLEQGGEFSRLNCGSFTVRTGERPESIGRHIGEALYQGMAEDQQKENGGRK